MAEISPQTRKVNDDAVSVQWKNIAAGDTCVEYVGFSDYSDRSVQIEGSFGGATISIEGSNDGANYQVLNDPFGTLLTASSPKLRQVLEYVWKMRPAISGGAGVDVTVTIIAKRIRS